MANSTELAGASPMANSTDLLGASKRKLKSSFPMLTSQSLVVWSTDLGRRCRSRRCRCGPVGAEPVAVVAPVGAEPVAVVGALLLVVLAVTPQGEEED